MSRGKIIVICIIILFVVPMFASLLFNNKSDDVDKNLLVAVNKCAYDGYRYEKRGDGAVCILKDGTECDIYMYYNGLCGSIV